MSNTHQTRDILIDTKKLILEQIAKRDILGIRNSTKNINNVDLANLVKEVGSDDLFFFIRALKTLDASEVFAALSQDQKKIVLAGFDSSEIKKIFNELATSEIVDLIDEMPANIVTRIKISASPELRQNIITILNYPENSCGNLLNFTFPRLHIHHTIKEALEIIKNAPEICSNYVNFHVVDDNKVLVGYVTLRNLFFASNHNKKLEEIIFKDIVKVKALDDGEKAIDVFKKYDLSELPVVNSDDCLIGIIPSEEIIDLIEEEVTEDFQRQAAVEGAILSYHKDPVRKFVSGRIRWLVFLMLSATLSQAVISLFILTIQNHFLGTFGGQIVLNSIISLIPLISGTAGNAGSQTASMVHRSLVIRDITTKDYWKIVFKEIKIALFIGLIIAFFNAIRMIAFDFVWNKSFCVHGWQWLELIATFLAMMVAIFLAKIVGATLPVVGIIFQIDPALMAAPLLTTITDAVTTAIFFSISLAVFLLVPIPI